MRHLYVLAFLSLTVNHRNVQVFRERSECYKSGEESTNMIDKQRYLIFFLSIEYLFK